MIREVQDRKCTVSEEEVKTFIDGRSWTTAKAIKNPHQYIVKTRLGSNDKNMFDEVVKFIDENGKVVSFWRQLYMQWEYDGYIYWTMGDTYEGTIILNRALV